MTDDAQQVPIEIDFAGPFTANELVEIEGLTGATLDEIGTGASATVIRAVAWIVGRRTNPDLTLEQAGELSIRLDGRA